MNWDHLAAKAAAYLQRLCVDIPNRRTGSPGNRAATDLFAQAVAAFGFEVERPEFDCLDWTHAGADLHVGPDGKLELRAAQDLPAALAGGWSSDPQTWHSLQRGQVAAPQDELGFALAVPLNLPAAAKRADPLAVLALGPHLSGVGFSREDHALLVTLADHSATAIYLTRSVQNAGENHR